MIKQIAAAIVMAATSFAASAAEATPYYVGVDAGYTKVDHFDNDTSFGIFGGYKFTPNVAVEASFRKLGEFGIYGVNTDVKQTALSVLVSAPVADKLSVYGRVGYNRIEASARGYKAHDNKGLYGIGVSYEVAKNVAARVEWQRPSNDGQNLSVGVSYAF
ncbi:outer membrane beta-barrel protein [Massilia sp. SR12]